MLVENVFVARISRRVGMQCAAHISYLTARRRLMNVVFATNILSQWDFFGVLYAFWGIFFEKKMLDLKKMLYFCAYYYPPLLEKIKATPQLQRGF